MEQLNAFKELYQELVDRYSLFCSKQKIKNPKLLSYHNLRFEERYINNNKLPKRFIIEWDTDFVSINYDEMSLGLSSLVKMEADLIKLEQQRRDN